MAKAARLHSGLLARGGQAVPAADAARAPRGRPGFVSFVGAATVAARAIPVAPPSAGRSATPPAPVGERVRLTVRLDRRRYRQLKILAARTGRTGQEVVLAALDSYFEGAGRPCACLRAEDDDGGGN